MKQFFRAVAMLCHASESGLYFWIGLAMIPAFFLLAGCARGGCPIISQSGHLGIGWFVARKPIIVESSRKFAAPRCVEIEGVGVLFAPGRLAVGYTQTSYIAVSPGDDAHVKLSNLEVFAGRRAEASAYLMFFGDPPYSHSLAVPRHNGG